MPLKLIAQLAGDGTHSSFAVANTIDGRPQEPSVGLYSVVCSLWRGQASSLHICMVQDSDEEYEAALERRRLEVEAEKRMQQEEDARLLRALTAQEELPGDCLSHKRIIL